MPLQNATRVDCKTARNYLHYYYNPVPSLLALIQADQQPCRERGIGMAVRSNIASRGSREKKNIGRTPVPHLYRWLKHLLKGMFLWNVAVTAG